MNLLSNQCLSSEPSSLYRDFCCVSLRFSEPPVPESFSGPLLDAEDFRQISCYVMVTNMAGSKSALVEQENHIIYIYIRIHTHIILNCQARHGMTWLDYLYSSTIGPESWLHPEYKWDNGISLIGRPLKN